MTVGLIPGTSEWARTQVGLLAARPAAGVIGARYFATDTLQDYVDDGTIWHSATPASPADSDQVVLAARIFTH